MENSGAQGRCGLVPNLAGIVFESHNDREASTASIANILPATMHAHVVTLCCLEYEIGERPEC